jgi:O-antigen/teichoic acid export membrane protein
MATEATNVDSATRRNVVAYYANFLVVAALGVVVNPVLVGALGPAVFGVWKSLQRYLDFATVADGRASQALKWIVASRTSLSDAEKQRDIGAAITVWFRWLPVAALVTAGVTAAMPFLIKGIPDDARTAAYTAAVILAANTVLAGLLAIPDSVLTGINQGYKSMIITTVVFVASNGAMIGAAYAGWTLWSLAAIVLLAAILNTALTLAVAKRAVPWWGIAKPTKPDIRRVFGYSAWTLGGMLVDKMLLASELIVISVMIGAVAVTQYTFTAYVLQFVLSISLVTASGFMPVLGAQLGNSEMGAAAERTRSVRRLVIGVTVLGCAAVLAFNGTFVTLWVGADQYLGNGINMLLVVCALQQAFMRMDGQILDVTLRIAPRVMVGLASSAGGIAFGCIGFALTHDLRVALIAVIIARLASNVAYPIFVRRAIPGSAAPRSTVLLGGSLLVVSFGAGVLMEDLGGPGQTIVVLGWLSLAAATAWFGLLPRAILRALLNRRSSS